jgi:hypothetical protein
VHVPPQAQREDHRDVQKHAVPQAHHVLRARRGLGPTQEARGGGRGWHFTVALYFTVGTFHVIFAVKTPIYDSRYIPCIQSDARPESEQP